MIYLDYNASTPLDGVVFDAMMPYFRDNCANASSTHGPGRLAAGAVEKARRMVAKLIDAEPDEIFFTSGATESNNLALAGFMRYATEMPLVISQAEHKAVFECANWLEDEGCDVRRIKPDAAGMVAPSDVYLAIQKNPALVSVMLANNETGTINPVAEISSLVKECGGFVHTDVTQAIGRMRVSVKELGVNMLSLSGHKIYGPKGVGALFVSKSQPRVRLAPIIHGGGQEKALRSGTLNVPGIVGLGKACEIAKTNLDAEPQRLKKQRDMLERELFGKLSQITLNGHREKRLCNTLNISIAGINSAKLLDAIGEHVAFSNGSACNGGLASHVLEAMGISAAGIESAVRMSIGRYTTDSEIIEAASLIADAVREIRNK